MITPGFLRLEPDCSAVTARIRAHLGAPETREFVGGPVDICCGWTTRRSGERTSLEDLVARSDWAMLESREARRADPFRAGGG